MNSKDLTENDTKHANQDEHQEKLGDSEDNLIYNDLEEEPELHARTIIACAAIFTLVFVQVYALASPPFVVSSRELNTQKSHIDTLKAAVHRRKPPKPRDADLDSQCSITGHSSPRTSLSLRIRCLPSPKGHFALNLCHRLHWGRHRTRIPVHRTSHRRTNVDRRRWSEFSSGILCPK